ncbi:hypothetical protein FQN50_009985 [Emmonsiellopsis sp. PD_5]|nr:hypothetical protein FQN50_009985 [Emmonsiellopsis sp. PD_5]
MTYQKSIELNLISKQDSSALTGNDAMHETLCQYHEANAKENEVRDHQSHSMGACLRGLPYAKAVAYHSPSEVQDLK